MKPINHTFSEQQQEALARINNVGALEFLGGMKRIAETRKETAKAIWDSLLEKLVNEPYRSAMYEGAGTMATIEDHDVSVFQRVGKGGTATVDCGWSWRKLQPVAIKTMLYKLSEYCDLVRREQKTLSSLGQELGKPPLAPRFSFSKTDVRLEPVSPHVGMEYIDGVSLESIRLSWEDAPLSYKAYALAETSDLLRRMHVDHGLLHRDFNPRNVMFDIRRGIHLLIDFGTSSDGKEMDDDVVSFTEAYMPPERIEAKKKAASYTRALDVYSLGATAHFLQTGVHPTANLDHDSRLLEEETPKIIADFIMLMRAPDPKKRPSATACHHFFLSVHLMLNGHLIPSKSGNTTRTARQFYTNLRPEERLINYKFASQAREDPLGHYRESNVSVRIDPGKLVEGPLASFFPKNPKAQTYFTD